ncbi:hypothetical protein ACROYT_G007398 [Oculina patagonica]
MKSTASEPGLSLGFLFQTIPTICNSDSTNTCSYEATTIEVHLTSINPSAAMCNLLAQCPGWIMLSPDKSLSGMDKY